MDKKMEFIDFDITVELIDDIPPRPLAILKFLIGEEPLPDDMKLPDHEFFRMEDWKNIFHDRPDISPRIKGGRIVGNIFSASGIDYHETDTLYAAFLDWLISYTKRFTEDKCISIAHPSTEVAPVIVFAGRTGLSAIDLNKILESDGPVILDPGSKTFRRLPSFGTLKEAVKEAVNEMTSRCETGQKEKSDPN